MTPAIPPTTLITRESIRAELVPPVPERYRTTTMAECAANGMFEGLDDVGFDLKIMAADPNIKLRMLNENFKMPEFIWKKINLLSFDQIAEVNYTIVRFVHARNAYNATGYQRLILELAGEDNFLSILEEVKPLLRRWGLDKGSTKANGLEYATVINVFIERRTKLFSVYGLNDYLALGDFILLNPLDYWPEELVEPFRDSATLLAAMNGVGKHFASAKLHSGLRRAER